MSDQNFREIQLSGKQLVFLFMTAVVVAVGVFLLGVSVGRGVPVGAGLPAADQTTELLPPADLPPPTEVTAGDRSYHDTLQGTATPPAETIPHPEPPVAPVEDDDVVNEPAPADTPPAAPAVQTPPPSPPPAPPPSTRSTSASTTPAAKPDPPPPAGGSGWFVQVGAFRSRENAERQVQQLTAKGYAAALAPATAGGLYRVRVGSFADRAEADRTAARLVREEGLKPSVTR